MHTNTQSKIQLFGAWCGLLYMVVLILGWALIAGFVPPHRPSAGADVIAAIFRTDTLRIRIGMIIIMAAAMIIIPFSAAIARHLAQIEGGAGILTFSSLLGGAATMILTFYPAIWWLVAAYRPERPAELIYLMNDLAWLQLIGGVTVFFALPGSIAVAAICDSSVNPVFPRWVGFFCLWVIVLIVPDQLIFFFHSGPFAWSGLFGLWIPLAVFGAWFLVIFQLLRKAALRERGNA